MALARLHVRIPVIDAEGDKVVGGTVRFYEPGTAAVDGVTTTGTPFAGNLYAAVSGGSPVSTTQTSDANGEVVIYTDTKSRFDVGVEIGGASPAARVASYETFELDPADVMTSASGTQSVLQTGTLAAPSLAWTSDLDTGFNVDSDGEPAVVKDGIGILEVASTTTSLRSPDGTEAVTLTDAGVFSAPGLLRRYNIYMVEDEGMVYGITTTNAAANKTAWEALIAKIGASGEDADIHINDSLPLDGGINLAHAAGSVKRVNIIGKPGRSSILWDDAPAGGTTAYLDAGSNGATSALFNCGIYDLEMYHAQIPTSVTQPTIRIGVDASLYTLERVVLRNAGSGLAALIGIDALTGFELRNSKIALRDDTATLTSGGLFAVGLQCSATTNVSGPNLRDVSIDGISTNDPTGARSYAIRFVNAGDIDTPRVSGFHCKGHSIAILKNSGEGGVGNFNADHLYLDVVEYGVFLEPPTNGDCGTWMFNQTWIAARKTGLYASEGNGGVVENLNYMQGFITNTQTAALPAVYVGSGVSQFLMQGYNIQTSLNASGDYAVQIDGDKVVVIGNIIATGTSASGTILVAAGATRFTVNPNVLIGTDIVNLSTLSDSKVLLDRAFSAS